MDDIVEILDRKIRIRANEIRVSNPPLDLFLRINVREARDAIDTIESLREEVERLRKGLEAIAEGSDRGRHDGLPEEGPALDEFEAWMLARETLAALGD